MDDLRGLLNKEGIDINTPTDNSGEDPDIPTLSPNNIEVSDITDAVNNDLIGDFEQKMKQRISGNPEPEDDTNPTDLPILDGTITVSDENSTESSDLDDYISDMEDDDFDVIDFASSVEELEEKVGAITEPEHLQEFVEQHSENNSIQDLKSKLQKHLALEIENAMDELKNKLQASLNQEIDKLFKK